VSCQPEISLRDLRLRSKEIMDSVERGQTFVVIRDGHPIGELVPLRHRRVYIRRNEFLAKTEDIQPIDVDRFRADLEAAIDDEPSDPYVG
jgi:antitoxin (DNA-binding transcriptional repressor) of toxin-antitoxin stability system